MTIHPAQYQPALRPVARRASAAVEQRPQQSTAPSESVELNSRETTAKPSIARENLRPGDQHEAGLKGALNAIGGFLGVAMTKAMRGVKGPLMTGAWKDLLVASYEVPKEALQPYLPEGVELDSWNGKHYMSLVALQCQDIQGLGVKVPGGDNFEQVNLRFYAKRNTPEGEKKGAVFIKQIVASEVVAFASKALLNESVSTASMSHKLTEETAEGEVSYRWDVNGTTSEMSAHRVGQAKPLVEGSQEEFLLENYNGFSVQRDGQTIEYKVEHPPWKTYEAANPVIDVDAVGLYGKELAKYLSGPPSSVIIVDGSKTAVFPPTTAKR